MKTNTQIIFYIQTKAIVNDTPNIFNKIKQILPEPDLTTHKQTRIREQAFQNL